MQDQEPLERFYVLQPQNGRKNYVNTWFKRDVIVLEIIVEDAGKLYTAFLAVHCGV